MLEQGIGVFAALGVMGRGAVAILLCSPVPIVMLWGEDGIMIYNDAYSVFAGARHPRLLGSKVLEGWAEVADFNANVMRVGLSGGTLTYRDQHLVLYRNGVAEDVWMNLDYSPVLDESGKPAGVLAIVVETTERIIGERRLRMLSEGLKWQIEACTAELQHQAARLRRLAGELTSAEQRERTRLAAFLHDDLQQQLVAAKMRLGQARGQLHDPATVSAAIESAIKALDQALSSSRDLTRELRPPVLYEGGLLPAVRWLASEFSKLHGLHIAIDAENAEPPLGDDVKALLFEGVRELLFNVVKHAGVKEAAVHVRQDGKRLQITVADEGIGFDINSQPRGMGLFNIHERLAALDGSIAMESSPGEGTRIGLTILLPPTLLR